MENYLWACIVSNGKSAPSLSPFLCYLMCLYFFPLTDFTIFSLSLVLSNLVMMCLGALEFKKILYGLIVFMKFKKFLAIYFFKYFFLVTRRLLGTPIWPLLGCLKLSYSSLMLCLLFFCLFFSTSFILDSLYCYVFNA